MAIYTLDFEIFKIVVGSEEQDLNFITLYFPREPHGGTLGVQIWHHVQHHKDGFSLILPAWSQEQPPVHIYPPEHDDVHKNDPYTDFRNTGVLEHAHFKCNTKTVLESLFNELIDFIKVRKRFTSDEWAGNIKKEFSEWHSIQTKPADENQIQYKAAI